MLVIDKDIFLVDGLSDIQQLLLVSVILLFHGNTCKISFCCIFFWMLLL